MIVVDSNVLAYLYLAGEHTTAAEALRLGTKLATMDKKLLKSFPHCAVALA
jgi:predicted nucleic acid-binding protein